MKELKEGELRGICMIAQITSIRKIARILETEHPNGTAMAKAFIESAEKQCPEVFCAEALLEELTITTAEAWRKGVMDESKEEQKTTGVNDE